MKTFVLTGATAGIGKITAIAIAKAGHRLVFNTRSLEKGEKVRQEIIAESKNTEVYCYEGDFASLASVQAFAEKVKADFPVIDVLVNNAGTWEMDFKESQDGIETNFAVNHLAPFLLTNLLLENIKKAEAGRIVNTASGAHRRNILQFEDIEFRTGEYNGFYSYSQSKLCNLLHSLQLNKNLRADGSTYPTVNTLHPGLVKTALFDKMTDEQRAMFGNFVTPGQGAESTIFLALSPEVEGISGKYWHRGKEAISTDMAKDEALAEKLWAVSEEYLERVSVK